MVLATIFLFIACGDDDDGGGDPQPQVIELVTARMGSQSLLVSDPKVLPTEDIVLSFSVSIDPGTNNSIKLFDSAGDEVTVTYVNTADDKIITMSPGTVLDEGLSFTLNISSELKGAQGETYEGLIIEFETRIRDLEIESISSDELELDPLRRNLYISYEPVFEVTFTHEVEISSLEEHVSFSSDRLVDLSFEESGERTYTITPEAPLEDLTRFELRFREGLGEDQEREFEDVTYDVYTPLDTLNRDFPEISDEELLTLIQRQTFKYFWDFGHPVSGLARERNTSGQLVTSGGSGFGLMAMIVAVERGFITREEALDRWETIFNFLAEADRFHGAWSHWLNGTTGEVIPFSEFDDGGDLVETAFLVQGMITVRQYLNGSNGREKDMIDLIDELWHGVEWDWYRRGGQNVLYWHWSPEHEWRINLPIRGHNETQIIYTLAAASPTHSIPVEVYEEGYARSGNMQNGNTFYGYELPLGQDRGGPLFFTHYSYLGMDPRNLEGPYANYWEQNVNHTLINRAHCIDNPGNFAGYSDGCWGLTASDGNNGYSAHSPNNDRGVITPTAAISSIPFTPEESLKAIRHFYYYLGDRLWGEYGFYDAFNPSENWVASSFLAIDQGPIICMIENYRTGLLWDLYMSAPEVQEGLDKLGFTY